MKADYIVLTGIRTQGFFDKVSEMFLKDSEEILEIFLICIKENYERP